MSVEALHQSGVRYEARPDFVAILGILTETQVMDLVKTSTKIRRLRDSAYSTKPCQLSRGKQINVKPIQKDSDAKPSGTYARESTVSSDLMQLAPEDLRQEPGTQGCSHINRLNNIAVGSLWPQSLKHRSTKRSHKKKTQPSGKGELAFKMLSIVGSVASVVSLARELWRSKSPNAAITEGFS